MELELGSYLQRFTNIANSMINCGTILNWLEVGFSRLSQPFVQILLKEMFFEEIFFTEYWWFSQVFTRNISIYYRNLPKANIIRTIFCVQDRQMFFSYIFNKLKFPVLRLDLKFGWLETRSRHMSLYTWTIIECGLKQYLFVLI